MALKDDLVAKVAEYAQTPWADIPQGQVVPMPESLTFGNTGVRINATVLYADIDGSTGMVDNLWDTLAAEYYKAYLCCAAKIIRANGGSITAYDGDRIMAIYMGPDQGESAIIAALQLQWALHYLINPVFAQTYPQSHRQLNHTIGIDASSILAAKTGVRVDSDIVWVGPAANHAAKLNNLHTDYAIRVTGHAINTMPVGPMTFYRTSNGQTIWDGPNAYPPRGVLYQTNCFMEIR